MDESHRGHEESSEDVEVEIEELSDSLLKVRVGRLTTDVTVERIYRTPRSFGEFRSIESVVAFLRKKAEEEE